jgi:hypothetical protein
MSERLTIKDVQSLELRFPYMFAGPKVGMEYYKGWFPDFVDLCFEVDALLGDYRPYFYWNQMKEKFGGCRIYCGFHERPYGIYSAAEGDEGEYVIPEPLKRIRAELWKRIEATAAKMNAKCCVCGETAKTQSHDGWIGTLCGYHNIAARNERGDTRPLVELTAVPLKPVIASGGKAQ